VEGRVETGDRRHLRKDVFDRVEGGERLRLMQRGKVGEDLEAAADVAVDDGWSGELGAAMHDATTDRADVTG
jgi:hypothetical protein